MKIKTWLQCACTVAAFVALAAASSVPVTFTSGTSNLGGSPNPPQGVFYYPYQLIVNGATVTVACDDFDDTVHLGEQWNATVSTFAGGLTNTLFWNAGDPNGSLKKYQETAYLYSNFTPAPPGPLDNNVNAAINWAIWDLMGKSAGSSDPNLPGTFGAANCFANTSACQQTSGYWLNLAQTTNLSNFDFSNFVIFTPVNGWPSNDGRPQEYIGEVPEPGTVLLMASGLLGLAGLAWRRRVAFES
ncbi:MAG TPA: PEP-CTERM sorting domain-containing protein [Terriglobales bacterium]|nr:PEP-CTERM sorting domain-containing protein [Terriglobales bacterium]